MKFIQALLPVLWVAVMASANTPDRVISLYHQGDFRTACLEGARILRDSRDDETFVNAYGIACLKSDFIDLAVPAVMYLRSTPGARQNANYILTVVLQKKMLYHALADNVDIRNAYLPDTPHVLSKVYNTFAKGNFTETSQGVYEMRINDRRVTLDSLHDGGHFKIRIRQYDNGRIIDEHLYW
ncbi:MAG: hypothetical protein AB7E49_03190 [Campylobacterales bacterium]